MAVVKLVDGFLEGVLRVEDQHIGPVKEFLVLVKPLHLVDIEFTVAGENEGPIAFLNAVPVGAAGMGHPLAQYPQGVQVQFAVRPEIKEILGRLHLVQGHREMREHLLVVQSLLQVGQRGIQGEPDPPNIKWEEKGYDKNADYNDDSIFEQLKKFYSVL